MDDTNSGMNLGQALASQIQADQAAADQAAADQAAAIAKAKAEAEANAAQAVKDAALARQKRVLDLMLILDDMDQQAKAQGPGYSLVSLLERLANMQYGITIVPRTPSEIAALSTGQAALASAPAGSPQVGFQPQYQQGGRV